jgi:hypothetical protein
MHILTWLHHFAALRYTFVEREPCSAYGLSLAFYQSPHMLHTHLFANIPGSLSTYYLGQPGLALAGNQTIPAFLCCCDIPGSSPGYLSCFHPVLSMLFHQHEDNRRLLQGAYAPGIVQLYG